MYYEARARPYLEKENELRLRRLYRMESEISQLVIIIGVYRYRYILKYFMYV